MGNINQLIALKPVQIGSIVLNKKFEWIFFQFRKDTKTAMLNGMVRFYDQNGNEINQNPIVPIAIQTETRDGRDFINSANGAYCVVELDGTYSEVISGNAVDASSIISQFQYFANLLSNGVDILQLIPAVVADLDNRGML